MSLREDIPDIIAFIQSKTEYLALNNRLFRIFEGELAPFVQQVLQETLSPQSYDNAKDRVAPINVLQRLIDKLSKIYQQKPTRVVIDGSDSDSNLQKWYEFSMRTNQKMNIGNEFFNLTKTTLIEPYVFKGKPKLRSILPNSFLPYTNNSVDRTEPTHIITFNPKHIAKDGTVKKTFNVITDEEFVIIDDKGQIQRDRMAAMGNPNGINPYGRIPFVYVNRSSNLLLPIQDTDTFIMTVLIPILLSDLNFAVKFQAFSIFWGINVDDQNIKMAPNAFWSFKSDPTIEGKPEIGTIKPTVDIDQVLNLIKSELAFWLNSKGVKTSSMGSVDGENFASGISKIMDEIDTVEDRVRQIQFFEDAEVELWDLIMHRMHPVWVGNGLIERTELFTPNIKVAINFSDQIPLVRRGDLVKDLKEEIAAGFNTRRRVLKILNPKLNDKEIDELMEEIDEERGISETEEGPVSEEKETKTGITGLGGSTPHEHDYAVDGEGNGKTTSGDHAHQIVASVVQETNNHTHLLGG